MEKVSAAVILRHESFKQNWCSGHFFPSNSLLEQTMVTCYNNKMLDSYLVMSGFCKVFVTAFQYVNRLMKMTIFG